MSIFKGLKKQVEYEGVKYNITFETIDTDDMDITYVVVNNKQIDVRTYEDYLTINDLKGMITKAIEEYLKITKPERLAKGLIDEFIKWDGKLWNGKQ